MRILAFESSHFVEYKNSYDFFEVDCSVETPVSAELRVLAPNFRILLLRIKLNIFPLY